MIESGAPIHVDRCGIAVIGGSYADCVIGFAKLVAQHWRRGRAVIIAAVALTGCGWAVVPAGPATTDELRGPWRAEPLLVGPETRTQVDAACRADPELPDDMTLTVVDARGEGRLLVGYANPAGSSAWLEATMGPDSTVECHVLQLSGALLVPLGERDLRPASLTSSEDGDGWWTLFSSTAGADISDVVAEVPGHSPILATSTDDGWFVLWWPEEGEPPFEVRIVGLDADGAEIAELDHP